MSYRAYQVARLHGRDLVFGARYAKEKVRTGGRRKQLVLCNSYPKSGTHLLYQILYASPGFGKWNDIVSVQALCGIMNTATHIRWKIGSAPDRSIIRCHLTYCDEVLNVLGEHDTRRLFIYRDPRDVACSHARWVCREPRIFLHDVYTQHYNTDDERLMASILGTPLGEPFGSNVSQPNIGQDFARWKGWIDDPETLAVRFEDLVGERGGASEEKRLETIQQIHDHLEIYVPPGELRARFGSRAMNPEESHTFRKGESGRARGWQQAFTKAHKDAFKRVAGDLLIELDYERSLDW